MTKAIDRVYETCHTCASLRYLPPPLLHNSTSDPPSIVGVSFAADVIQRSKQTILVLRETSTSFTSASIIPDEKSTTLRDSLSTLFVNLHSPDGPAAVVRVDPAPRFIALQNDPTLRKLGMTLEIGRVKNVNKNPQAFCSSCNTTSQARVFIPPRATAKTLVGAGHVRLLKFIA